MGGGKVGGRSGSDPVGATARADVPVCSPTSSVRDVARVMTAARSRCAVIVGASGSGWGIVTDGDLRRRVVADGLDPSADVARVMTTPARTVVSTRSAADASMDMIAWGVRHLIVLDASGGLVGVVDDGDLFSSATRAGVAVRSAIARASDVDALICECARIPSVMVDMTASRVAPMDVTAIGSVLMQSAVARAADLVGLSAPVYVLGSVARREALPSSDIETAAVLDTVESTGETTQCGASMHEILLSCGLRPDPHHAVISQRRFVRTAEQWAVAVDEWIADPQQDRGVVMLSLLADSVPVAGSGHDLAGTVTARLADAPRATSSILREATEERAKLVLRDKIFRRTESADLKDAVLSSITDIARWAGVSSRSADRTTPGRLDDAAAAGVLSDDDAQVLRESFDVVQRIRLDHQCDQLRAGVPPDDVVLLGELTPLARSLLSNAAREVAGMQRALAYSVS